MRAIFADTSFFVALLNPRDDLHQKAVSQQRALHPFHLVTTEMVLAELLNDFGARGEVLRQSAVSFVEEVRRASLDRPARVTIIPQTAKQFASALSIYRERMDKTWSLTDCASYVVMEAKSLTETLTYDRHFEQMGFVALLRE